MAGAASPTIFQYLEQDHRRLDDMLPDIEQLVGRGAFDRAVERFADFSTGLSRHIDAEEQVLFPAFESLVGGVAGPTTVMRAEHVEIRRQLASVSAALGTGDRAGFDAAVTRLVDVLAMHNLKEEQMLYPMVDRALAGPHERSELIGRMQAI